MASISEESEKQKSGTACPGSRWIGAAAWPVAVVVVLVAALLAGVYLFTRALDTAERIVSIPERAAEGLGKIFESKVVVDSDSLVVADRSIAELAIMERRIVTTTKYETSFIGVKATAIIKGVYRVKTGYDLGKPYHFNLDAAGKVVQAELPQPEILSIETENQEIFYLSESMISSIDPEEWEDAYRENRLAAEQEAKSLGILEETRERFLERASDLLGGQGLGIEMPAL